LLSAIPLPDPDSEKTRQRKIYDPSIHDYNGEEPELREVSPGHYVSCSQAEFATYTT